MWLSVWEKEDFINTVTVSFCTVGESRYEC
jgi:hypothetical protein